MKIVLIRVDFDGMENHSPRSEQIVEVFTDGSKLTAIGEMRDWFQRQEPVKLYSGYDGQIYPQFKTVVRT